MSAQLLRRAVCASVVLNGLLAGVAAAQGSAQPLPQAAWTLYYVDSQDTSGGDYRATNAFDGNPSTMWATEWFEAAPPPPHDLAIDLGASYAIEGFRYLPRQDGAPQGRIDAYEFYVSGDGVNWGAPVVSGRLQNSGSEQAVAFAAITGRYVLLRALSEANGREWTTIAELNVLGKAGVSPPPGGEGGWLPKANWRVRSVDSEDVQGGDYAAWHVFDGDAGTIWSTEWFSSSPPPPHELQIDLGAAYAIDALRYLPRQDVPYGRIADYQLFVSADGIAWGGPIASGTFPDTAEAQLVTFPARTARFVALRALSEVAGRPWATAAEFDVRTGSGSPPPPTGGNQSPFVVLAATTPGPYMAPASISMLATASDPDGRVTRVDFYSGSTLVRTDTLSPYTAALANLAAGTYAIVAVATDDSGNTTVSNTIALEVWSPQMPSRAVFTPSADHDTLVERYVLEIFPFGADPLVANPVATLDLGKPAVVNGECEIDVGWLITGLWPGTYIGTVTAVGNGGASRSEPSPPFVR